MVGIGLSGLGIVLGFYSDPNWSVVVWEALSLRLVHGSSEVMGDGIGGMDRLTEISTE